MLLGCCLGAAWTPGNRLNAAGAACALLGCCLGAAWVLLRCCFRAAWELLWVPPGSRLGAAGALLW
eukprot:11190608-Lingulodinium_polyedra.AAC.1